MLTGDSTTSRADLKVAALLALVVTIVGVFWIRPLTVGTLHDDGVYVTTAKALAEGRGYRVISLPNEPLQTKYPILYPAALAVVWKLWPAFPDNVVALKGVSLIFAAATIALTYLYLIRFGYFSRRVAAWACAICATTPFFHVYAAQALSCPVFALLVIVALWRLDRLVENPNATWRTSLLAGMVIGLPFLARSIGIVVSIPVLAAKLQSRRQTAYVMLGVALVWLPWALWVAWALDTNTSDPITKFQTDYLGLQGSLNGGPNFSFLWSETSRKYVPAMLLQNAGFAVWSGAALALGGLTSLLSLLDPRSLILMVAGGAVTWWTVARGGDDKRVLKWFLLAYVFLLWIWPWRSTRFFMPVLALLTPFLLSGSSGLLRSVAAPRHAIWVARIALISVVTLNTVGLLPWKYVPFLKSIAASVEEPELWPSISAALDWLKTNSSANDVIAASPDSLVYLYTSRKAIQPFVFQPAGLFYGARMGATGTVPDFVTHVMSYRPRFLLCYPITLGGDDFANLVKSASGQFPGWLTPVYRAADPRVIVYEFDWNRAPARQQ